MRRGIHFHTLAVVVCAAWAVIGCQEDATNESTPTNDAANGLEAKSEVSKTLADGTQPKTLDAPNKPKVVSKLIVNPLKGLFDRTFTKRGQPAEGRDPLPDEMPQIEEFDQFGGVEEIEELEELEELEIEDLNEEPLEDAPLEDLDLLELSEPFEGFESVIGERPLESAPDEEPPPAAMNVELSEFGMEQVLPDDLLRKSNTYRDRGASGRGHAPARSVLITHPRNAHRTESAVASSLNWLAEHQMPDGGWSFAHHTAPKCKGQCGNPGEVVEARNAATAMALLPFFGAGQTHQVGEYKDTVKAGLYYLIRRMKVDAARGGSFHEKGGTMYSHGLAAIVICEAYAMTHDKALYKPAQSVVNFITYAQDPVGGGWRYQPRQRGDMSVTGWQLVALRSGHGAYLQVPPATVKKAAAFLDSVQANSGANYGYTGPGEGPATTAMGLLCRMVLGWKKDNPALQKGVKWLSEKGPSNGDMYFNYFATQVMMHYGGEEWKKWNAAIRDLLVESQATEGHEKGSWHFDQGDIGAARGGRLYCTSLAVLILEVYYRHPPMFKPMFELPRINGPQPVEEEPPE